MAAKWQLLDTLPGGHRLFTRSSTRSIYIADESGQTPDQTDDGVMWLDRTSPLSVGLDADGGHVCTVPVVADVSSSYRVGVTVADILWLSDRYSWAIETTGGPSYAAGEYRAVRTA